MTADNNVIDDNYLRTASVRTGEVGSTAHATTIILPILFLWQNAHGEHGSGGHRAAVIVHARAARFANDHL